MVPPSSTLEPAFDFSKDRYAQAAQASRAAYLIGALIILLVKLAPPTTASHKLIVGIVCLAMHTAGFGMALSALSGIKKRGSLGILPRARRSLVINGILILVIIIAFARARPGQ